MSSEHVINSASHLATDRIDRMANNAVVGGSHPGQPMACQGCGSVVNIPEATTGWVNRYAATPLCGPCDDGVAAWAERMRIGGSGRCLDRRVAVVTQRTANIDQRLAAVEAALGFSGDIVGSGDGNVSNDGIDTVEMGGKVGRDQFPTTAMFFPIDKSVHRSRPASFPPVAGSCRVPTPPPGSPADFAVSSSSSDSEGGSWASV